MAKVAGVLLLSALASQATLQGELRAHDPSRVVRTDDGYYLYFITGPLMPVRYSKDMVHWDGAPGIMKEIPDWAKKHVTRGNDWIWAPDIIFEKSLKKWVIFYSYSTFGSRRSVIGALTSPDLKLSSTWSDAGEVIGSVESDNYNAIDPCPIYDAKGKLWLSYGSWNTGIKVSQIAPMTLKPIGTAASIAGSEQTDMEASFLWRKDGFYYVFFNRGFCCRGVNSTYEILMGRSQNITGPYLDKAGLDCFGGNGGTVLMQTDGDRIGPGQAGISPDGHIFSFHFYNKKLNGQPNFGYGTVKVENGWPVISDIK